MIVKAGAVLFSAFYILTESLCVLFDFFINFHSFGCFHCFSQFLKLYFQSYLSFFAQCQLVFIFQRSISLTKAVSVCPFWKQFKPHFLIFNEIVTISENVGTYFKVVTRPFTLSLILIFFSLSN